MYGLIMCLIKKCHIFQNYLLVIIIFLMMENKCDSQAPTFILKNGTIDGIMEESIDFTMEIVYFYQIQETMKLNPGYTSIRIEVEAFKTFTTECPLLLTVRENQGLLSVELPNTYTDKHNITTFYYTAGKTLCISPKIENMAQTILVAISTCSKTSKNLKLGFWVQNDFLTGISESKIVNVSPTSPVFHRFYYDGDNKANFLFIDLDSDQITCAMISIQAPSCPVLDQENNIQFQGYWQTMTFRAGLTIRTNKYPDGFFLVIVVLKEDERCHEYNGIEYRDIGNPKSLLGIILPRSKKITFSINEALNKSGYILPTLIPLIFIFGLIVFVCIIFTGFQHLKYKVILEQVGYFDVQPEVLGPYRSRFQSSLNISDIEPNDCKLLCAESKRYYWSLLIIAIFYCVPVFQLIINYLKVVYRTGEQDICYYNFYCARPLGYIMDFNHIYSNIGYVLLGLTFIALVKLRQNSFYLGENENDEYLEISNKKFRKIFPILNSNLEYGVLNHFGLFYAMGLALVLEGLLSGAYHICPNQSNFQFDTSFMYAIAFLGIVKIFQFRHPVYISADITFISLAFVASSAVLGLLFNNLAFKISFSVVHLGVILILLLYLYYFGFITDDDGNILTNWIEVYKGVMTQPWRNSTFSIPHWSRLILPFLTIFCNVILIILIWTVMEDSNFATQILAIFVVNLFVYMTYYIIMKWIHNEYKMKLWIQPLIYLILSIGLWITSLYYFQNALSSWDKSPAESKTQNAHCIIYDFYDNHDVWHFLSAGALFSSFMLLLTIDDDLITWKHNRICVF